MYFTGNFASLEKHGYCFFNLFTDYFCYAKNLYCFNKKVFVIWIWTADKQLQINDWYNSTEVVLKTLYDIDWSNKTHVTLFWDHCTTHYPIVADGIWLEATFKINQHFNTLRVVTFQKEKVESLLKEIDFIQNLK